MYIWIGIILYVLIGIIRVGYDFIQPPRNQPRYIYEKRWGRIILYTFLWPLLMYITLDFFYFWQYFKKHFDVLLRLKKVDTLTTENTHKTESTGISRLSIIENKLKDKNEKEN